MPTRVSRVLVIALAIAATAVATGAAAVATEPPGATKSSDLASHEHAVQMIAEPRIAANVTYWHIVNNEVSWCLDSNHNGDVYINPCGSGNLFQMWESWEGGWTRNVATGLCLQGDGYFRPSSIRTTDCVWNAQRQNWRHWFGGWKLRTAFVDNWSGIHMPAECLSRLYGSAHDVTGVACQNPNGPNPDREEWYFYAIHGE